MGIPTTTDWTSYDAAAPAVTTEATSIAAEPKKPEAAGPALTATVAGTPAAPQPA